MSKSGVPKKEARMSEGESLPLKDRRERGLNDLSAVIHEMWGNRCDRHDGHCAGCVAWAVFDMMDRLTDSDVIEDK